MRPYLLATAAVALALAGPASAARVPVASQTDVLTAPSPMSAEFGGTALIFGRAVRGGDTIPPGATVLRVTFPVQADQTSVITASCPAGTGNSGYAQPLPLTDALSGGLDSPLGANPVRLGFTGTGTPAGSGTAYVLCTPTLTAPRGSVSVSRRGARAPVRFAATDDVAGLRKGERLPGGRRVLAVRLRAGSQLVNGQPLMVGVDCPSGGAPLLTGSSSRDVGTAVTGGELIQVQPPRGLRAGQRVTVYAVCGRLAI